MNTTLKPQSANPKTRIITIFLGMFFLLAGVGGLAATHFGDEVVAPAIMFLFAVCFAVIAAILIVAVSGPKNLVRQKREDIVEKEKVHAVSD